MIGNLFALTMIAMLAGTLVLIAKTGSRPTFRSCLFGVLIAVVVTVLAALGDVPHFCWRGGTVSPALLAGPLSGLVYAFVHDRAKAWLAVAVLGLSGCFLCFLGSQIVHEAHYVGGFGWTEKLQRNAELTRVQAAKFLVEAASQDSILPAGWFEDVWPKASNGEDLPLVRVWFRVGNTGYFWHTWFTGLYRLEEYDAGFWYPGGPVAQCAMTLEVRLR